MTEHAVPESETPATPPDEVYGCDALKLVGVSFSCCGGCHGVDVYSKHQFHGTWYETCCSGAKAAGAILRAEQVAAADAQK